MTTIDYNLTNILKYKSDDNMLKHARYIPNRTEGLMLITSSNKLVGYIAWEGDFVIAFEVSSEYQKSGYGTKLLKLAIEKGCRKLSVNENNSTALKFYRSFGFKPYKKYGRMIFMKYN